MTVGCFAIANIANVLYCCAPSHTKSPNSFLTLPYHPHTLSSQSHLAPPMHSPQLITPQLSPCKLKTNRYQDLWNCLAQTTSKRWTLAKITTVIQKPWHPLQEFIPTIEILFSGRKDKGGREEEEDEDYDYDSRKEDTMYGQPKIKFSVPLSL